MLTRRNFLKMSAQAAVTATGAFFLSAELLEAFSKQGKVVLTLGISQDMVIKAGAIEAIDEFCSQVEKFTNGELIINPVVLKGSNILTSKLHAGEIHLAFTSPNHWGNNPIRHFFGHTLVGLSAEQQFEWMSGEGSVLLNEFYSRSCEEAIFMGCTAGIQGRFCVPGISSSQDLAGLRFDPTWKITDQVLEKNGATRTSNSLTWKNFLSRRTDVFFDPSKSDISTVFPVQWANVLLPASTGSIQLVWDKYSKIYHSFQLVLKSGDQIAGEHKLAMNQAAAVAGQKALESSRQAATHSINKIGGIQETGFFSSAECHRQMYEAYLAQRTEIATYDELGDKVFRAYQSFEERVGAKPTAKLIG